jgi:hypothetical protein
MEKIVIGKLLASQSISDDTLGSVVDWPGAVKQESHQLGFQIGVLNVFRVRQEGDGKSNNLIADSRDHDIWYMAGFLAKMSSIGRPRKN